MKIVDVNDKSIAKIKDNIILIEPVMGDIMGIHTELIMLRMKSNYR